MTRPNLMTQSTSFASCEAYEKAKQYLRDAHCVWTPESRPAIPERH